MVHSCARLTSTACLRRRFTAGNDFSTRSESPSQTTGLRAAVGILLDYAILGIARAHGGVFDQLAMMQQFGAIPAGPPA
jgi:hypothetical protein